MHTQPTRVVEARVYTASLRIYGQLHLHPKGDVAALLNAPRPYLAMTKCRVFRRGVAHPPSPQDLSGEPDFLVIPKDTVLWVVAPEDSPPPSTSPRRNLYVLYPEGDYVLKGDFPMPENVRIADFLVRTFSERAFHQLYKAELRLHRSPRPSTRRSQRTL